MLRPNDEKWDEFHDPEIVDWRRVRAAIEHENTLTNWRLVWFLTSQGFLFTAFGIVLGVWNKDVNPVPQHLISTVLEILTGIGIFVCVYIGFHLYAGQAQHNKLRNWWEKKYGDCSSSILQVSSKEYKKHPPICGSQFSIKRLNIRIPPHVLPPFLFPIIFCFSWVYILYKFLSLT